MKWIITIALATLVVLLGFKFCAKSKIEWVSMNQPSQCEDILKEAVLYDGNIEAYTELSTAYLDYKISSEFLLYAIIMAHKYNYPQAYFDVYFALIRVFWADLTMIDDMTADMAVEYLIFASEREHHQAKKMVEKHNINRKNNSKDQILKIYKVKPIR